MPWSIRARLTAWYTGVVVTVLCAGTAAAIVVQRRLATDRLDAELARQIATVEGVMRTEFNEGLDMAAAVAETRSEVVAPGRILSLATTARTPLADWGIAVPSSPITATSENGYRSALLGTMRVRVLQHEAEHGGRRYVAAVGAPLSELEADHRELLFSQLVGIVVALFVATAGGWIVGRRTLKPLADLATQAGAITGAVHDERLRAPHPEDELGRLATAFNGVLDRLNVALIAQRQFMADASHELRTPVSIVRATAQVAIAREGRTSDDYRESLAIVAEQTARITRLVDDMFLLARGEARGVPVRREALYLDELAADAIRGLRVIADARDVQIDLQGDEGVQLSGDPALLERAIGNLLHNAIRHAQDAGQVTVTVQRHAGGARLLVRDDGPGVPHADRERIFERFASLDSGAGGAGLGLAIARWVAEAHGGHLHLSPSNGSTSEFVLSLPGDTSL